VPIPRERRLEVAERRNAVADGDDRTVGYPKTRVEAVSASFVVTRRLSSLSNAAPR
jgi:hypothetical protein